MEHPFNYILGDCDQFYKLGRIMGQGAFATVRLGTKLDNKSTWAIKIVKKASISAEDKENLASEIDILSKIRHPNIVELREVYENKQNVHFVMELMTGGELFDRIVQKEHYSEKEAKECVIQIVAAIKYCHDKGIVHRDLKPENLLYASQDADSALKLADFGFATVIHPNEMLHAACGTPGYVAPEVIAAHSAGYGTAVDMWSLGVIIYILLCGYPPFYDEDTTKLFAQIQSAQFTFDEIDFAEVSESAKDLISSLLVVDPSKRLTVDQVLTHSWLSDLTQTYPPLTRLNANLRTYNARRRFKGAIRAIQMTRLVQHKETS